MLKVSAAFLQIPNGKIVCQIRSNIKGISSPGMIAPFGGSVEEGETFDEGLVREIQEELAIDINKYGFELLGKFEHFGVFSQTMKNNAIYFSKIPSLNILILGEGAGLALIETNVPVEEIYMSEGSQKAWKMMQKFLANN